MAFQVKLVDKNSKKEAFAKSALFSKHEEMKCNCTNFIHLLLFFFQWSLDKCKCHILPFLYFCLLKYPTLHFVFWMDDRLA